VFFKFFKPLQLALFQPVRSFYKFWWCQELDNIKDRAIVSHKLWKEAGCPITGPIFDSRNKDKREYRIAIHRNEQLSTERFTNDLHNALLNKRGNQFW